MKIDHIAMLARLKLTNDEKEVFSGQLDSIIEYINKLNELDTKNIEPTAHVLDLENVFRDDELRPSLPVDNALRNTPERMENFYQVPKIIE